MQKIYLLYKNESAEKISKFVNLGSEIIKGESNIFDTEYFILNNGENNFKYVINYNVPTIIENKEADFSLLRNEGYDFTGGEAGKDIKYSVIQKSIGIKHIVKPLENLNSIAKIYNVDKEDIVLENNLKTEKLYIGQILYV